MHLNMTHKKALKIYFVIATIFILLQLTIFFNIFQLTDDFTYFYIGKAITEGSYPYKEIMAVHPPLHYYMMAMIYAIFGANFFILKFFVMINILIISYFLFKIVSLKYNYGISLVSVVLFLFSGTILESAYGSAGAFETLTFIIIAYYLFLKNKLFFSGIFFALGGLTRLYFFPIFLIVLFFSLIKIENSKIVMKYKNTLKIIFGFLVLFVPVNLFFILKYGSGYYLGVFTQQILSEIYGGYLRRVDYPLTWKLNAIWQMAKMNIVIFFVPFLLLLSKRIKSLAMPFLIIISYIIFILNLNEIFPHYFYLIFPFLAMISAPLLFEKQYFFALINNHLSKILVVSILVFFSISIATIVQNYNLIKESTDNEKSFLAIVDEISANSGPNDKIFGSDAGTHFIALKSDRRIIMDFVDQRVPDNAFRQFLELIKNRNDLKFIIFELRGTQDAYYGFRGINNLPEYRKFIGSICGEGKGYSENNLTYALYPCNQ